MRSTMISRSSPLLRFMHSRPDVRFFSDQGRVLEEEGRARENLYVQVFDILRMYVHVCFVNIQILLIVVNFGEERGERKARETETEDRRKRESRKREN